jgi:hypothetical protein
MPFAVNILIAGEFDSDAPNSARFFERFFLPVSVEKTFFRCSG